MKHTLYNTFRLCLFVLATMLPAGVLAQDNTGDVDDAESAAMAKTKQNAITWQETDPTGENYLSARRALVGRHCAVNRVINVVSVGSGTSGLENLTNEDTSDEAIFPSTAGITIAASPTVSVRDMKYYYAAGTTAGFCIVASSGSSVINLDVVKTMHLWFYCDGKRVADMTVREGNGGSGVKLSLIGIPGNQESCINLTAICPQKFDEVALVQGGGLDVSVASALRIKYAFVGDAHDINITRTGISDYCTEKGKPQYTVSCEANMPSPLVGGIPLPVVSSFCERAIDDDPTNTVPLVSAVQLASVAFKGNANIYAKSSDASVGELFEKGDQVGFKYNFVEVADVLKVGAWIEIHLYDNQGNQVQNTTISAEVLTLSLASGGDQTAYIVADQPFSGAGIYFYTALGVLNLGSGFGVYGAFVRPHATVDHDCMLNPTANTHICSNQTTHQLKSNPEINATWSLVSQPEENAGACSVTPDGFITGMNADGDYKFLVSSEDGQCSEEVTITHGTSTDFIEEPVEHAFYNIEGEEPEYALSDDVHGETSANFLSISNMENSENVLNANLTDYASYTGGLQLLGANGVIVGIKKLSEEDPYIYDGSKANAMESIHIGFVVEMEQTNLGVNLLNAFQIRCFDKDGNKLYESLVEDAGVVGLGVVGTNDKSNKLRLSITVPKVNGNGQPVKINEIQLWKVGVIDLKVSDVKFYYGFWDDPSDVRNNVVRDGAYVVNYDNMGAIVNLGTQVTVASVGGVTNNLSNIIDIDDALETYALVQKTVESGSQEIIVKLGRTVDFRHQVGVVVNNDIIGLNANVGNVLKVGTYYNGQETGEASSNWGVLGANVIQGSGKTVLLISPTSDYDEVHITVGQGLAANRTVKIYGILMRNDVDHDGVPDNRDEESCNSTISNIEVTHVCQGGNIAIKALGTTDTRYYVSFPDQGIENELVQSNIDGWINGSYATTTPGQFTMYFYDGNGDLLTTAEYTVHPLVTTWRKTTNNTNWNTWNNWTNGSPYLCTDVIIPSGARVYPSLDEEVVKGDEFGCNGIHFESRAAVEKVFKLNYNKAWVDVDLEPGRYYLLSAPLKKMYTGDMFIPEVSRDTLTEYSYFTDLTGSSYQPSRFAPRVYQRIWAHAGQNKLIDGSYGEASVLETNWSKRFNALKYGYAFGEGFSAYVDADGREADKFTFRFPKQHTAYSYFNEITRQATDLQETDIDRTDGARFAYEDAAVKTMDYTYLAENDRAVFGNIGSITLTATSPTSTNTFMVGNPFMSHIDVAEFLAANAGTISSVKVFNGNTTSSAVSVGESLASNEGLTTIEPMEAFFVTTVDEATSVDIAFTESMFKRDALPEEEVQAMPALRIVAKAGKLSSSTLLLSDEAPEAETLFDNEAMPELAVFTLDGSRALDIRSIASKDIVPLGIYVGSAGEVALKFEATGGFDLSEYKLYDRETGITYSLTDAQPTFAGMQTTLGRFALVKGDVTAQRIAELDGVSIASGSGKLTVSSGRGDISRVSAFSTDGRLISKATGSQSATVTTAPGVNLIKVERAGCPTRTYKILAH